MWITALTLASFVRSISTFFYEFTPTKSLTYTHQSATRNEFYDHQPIFTHDFTHH